MIFPDRVLTLIEQEIGIESDKELLARLVHECPVRRNHWTKAKLIPFGPFSAYSFFPLFSLSLNVSHLPSGFPQMRSSSLVAPECPIEFARDILILTSWDQDRDRPHISPDRKKFHRFFPKEWGGWGPRTNEQETFPV